MRRLEFARPVRTSTGHARNAGEAVQQLAHLARERQRYGQERQSLIRRIRKIDARLEIMSTLEARLLPMMRQEADRAKEVPVPVPVPVPAAAAAPTRPAPPIVAAAPKVVRPRTVLPMGLSEVTLRY
jgi:hypothetical protein